MTLLEAKEKRDALVLEKRTLETKLAAVRNLVRSSGRMPHDKYKVCCDSQTSYTRAIISLEAQILPLKREIERLANEEQNAKTVKYNGMPARDVVGMLREVRDKWSGFAADDSLGSGPERTIASQFVCDLNPIIHAILDPK
jgi:hypothetical protein